ncbi:ferredoxin [Sphaerobacter sp.]|uniref:ferredoxin n=1 Tax=Sphaerobacter sp. TaxID=2099654 RepID=UPI001DEC4EF5|nr:ferredoxin [Sphaerobacter sp.]MBX5446335.1 ferredoxin [Sphaerobacter sp.]
MSQRKVRIRVDPTRCTAFGFCAEFLPESFALDDWGYAWLQARELPLELESLAREAARLCPTGAISVEIVTVEDEPEDTATARPASSLRPRQR